MTHPIEDAVFQLLAADGWAKDRITSACTKLFRTAVGDKQAVVYLHQSREPHFVLTASYQSEGRNILEPCMSMIPLAANKDAANSAAQRFLDAIGAKIADSYAVKLLRA